MIACLWLVSFSSLCMQSSLDFSSQSFGHSSFDASAEASSSGVKEPVRSQQQKKCKERARPSMQTLSHPPPPKKLSTVVDAKTKSFHHECTEGTCQPNCSHPIIWELEWRNVTVYRTDSESGPEFVASKVLITYGCKYCCWAPVSAFKMHDCCVLLNPLPKKVLTQLKSQQCCPASLISWQPESPPASPPIHHMQINTDKLSDTSDDEPSKQQVVKPTQPTAGLYDHKPVQVNIVNIEPKQVKVKIEPVSDDDVPSRQDNIVKSVTEAVVQSILQQQPSVSTTTSMNRRDFAGASTALLKALGDDVKAPPQQYPCPHCGQVSFLTCTAQNSHIRMTHDLRFCCKLCGSTYITKVGLADHIKAKHMEDSNHKCDQCGKTFGYKSKLQEHMSTHRPSELLCTQCGKKFRDGANLCKHQKEQHQKLEILLHCPVCPYKHTLRRYVVYHILRAHNIKSGRLFHPTFQWMNIEPSLPQ